MNHRLNNETCIKVVVKEKYYFDRTRVITIVFCLLENILIKV